MVCPSLCSTPPAAPLREDRPGHIFAPVLLEGPSRDISDTITYNMFRRWRSLRSVLRHPTAGSPDALWTQGRPGWVGEDLFPAGGHAIPSALSRLKGGLRPAVGHSTRQEDHRGTCGWWVDSRNMGKLAGGRPGQGRGGGRKEGGPGRMCDSQLLPPAHASRPPDASLVTGGSGLQSRLSLGKGRAVL